jgi:phosphatidylserine decarboxylase
MTTRLIRWFVGKYNVNMDEAENPDIASYTSFNEFFTRPCAGVRPLAEAAFVCPVDGAISQFGAIDDHHILQAKGHRFTTTELVGGDAALAPVPARQLRQPVPEPKDYHRLHMPCDGRLTRMIYVPGALFSVNPTTARGVPRPVRPQRARGLRVRVTAARPVRDGAGRRHHRRQHGDRVARRGQSEAPAEVSEWTL